MHNYSVEMQEEVDKVDQQLFRSVNYSKEAEKMESNLGLAFAKMVKEKQNSTLQEWSRLPIQLSNMRIFPPIE